MSALEQSITLEDVFSVVEAKRVPLAPELAGYLALEIADGSDAGGGDVDPKTVFISEEGTVALVRPRASGLTTGDAEASVRRLLAKLLDASGSGTPALSNAAKRRPGNGLPALVEELEAALIPVNRAAGRRAMARLAREVKRVLLGVGRNASAAPVGAARTEAKPALKPIGAAAPHARPLVRKKSTEMAAPTSDRAPAPASDRERERPLPPPPPSVDPVTAALESIHGETSALSARALGSTADAIHDALTVDPGAVAAPGAASAAGPPAPSLPAPLPPSERGGLRPPTARRASAPAPTGGLPLPPSRGPVSELFGGDEVDNLLETFGVSNLVEDNKQVSRDLKAMAGLEPTPPPPDARTLAELTKDVGSPGFPLRLDTQAPGENASWTPPPPLDGDSVEALLALADASAPPPRIDARQPELPAPTPSLGSTGPSISESQLARRGQNLPQSPLFGGTAGGTTPGIAPGAPKFVRESEAELPPTPASTRDVDPPSSSRLDAKASGARPRAPEPRPPTTARGRVKSAPGAAGGKRAPKTGLALLVVTLVVLAGATGAIWKFAPQVFTGHRKPVATTPPASAAVPPPPVCKVALVLTDVPANAEILLRMGQAPVDVERMPVGTRLEFVGTAEGQTPKRTVIKADTAWDKGPDGKPRVEVPIQLDASKAKPGAVDPWPPAEPGSQVGGSGAPGTVHVVSNVRGAEVWLLAGLGPEARIDQLRCDADIDVLLAGGPASSAAGGDAKTPLRKRLHVSEKDIEAVGADPKGNKVVTVSGKTN